MMNRVFVTAMLAVTLAVPGPRPATAQALAVTVASPADAVSAALAHSASPRVAAAGRDMAQADSVQAALRPNPELAFVFENFGGVGGRNIYRGATQAESTMELSQRLELGGKRTARVSLAGRNEAIADIETDITRLDLAREVVAALADAVAAARLVDIEAERVRMAGEALRISRARADGGKEAPLQAQRASVDQATATLAVDRARREADQALRLLAALIGIRGVTLAPRQPWFDEIGQPPRHAIPADPLARLGDNPDLKRLDTTIAQRRADITLQRANAVPDVTARGGVRRFHESGETAFVASVAIPLPLSDRNQGGIQKANAELGRAEAEAERTRTGLVATLLAAEQRQTGAWTTAQTLRTRVVPAADQASRVAGLGYAEGKFSFLDLQDSRRSLSEARAALVEALKEFHRSRAEVDRLRGVMAGLPAQRATP